jgi:hypothetical protein
VRELLTAEHGTENKAEASPAALLESFERFGHLEFGAEVTDNRIDRQRLHSSELLR